MPIPSETVAIPIIKGIDVGTAARLIQPPELLEAVNSSFDRGGSSKRYGHTTSVAKVGSYPLNTSQIQLSTPTLTEYGEKIVDTNWLFGWGRITSATRSNDSDTCAVSPYPEAGYLFGGSARDNQVFGWNGHQLFDYAPSSPVTLNRNPPAPAVFPAIRVKPIAKHSSPQNLPDYCDNGVIKVVSWIDFTNTDLYYSVYDSVTNALLVPPTTVGAFVTPGNLRCVTLNHFIHLVVLDLNDSTIHMLSFEDTSPTTFLTTSLGSASNNVFDVWKVDENTALIAKLDASTIKTHWIMANGTPHPSYIDSTLDISGDQPYRLAVSVHPTTGHIGAVWTTTQFSPTYPRALVGGVFNSNGTPVGAIAKLETMPASEDAAKHLLAVAPHYLLSVTGTALFDAYATLISSSGFGPAPECRTLRRGFNGTSILSSSTSIWHLQVASQAIRAGDRTFVWMGYQSTLQSSWFLVDELLKPVAKFDFGIAYTPDLGGGNVFEPRSVGWVLTGVLKDQLVYHLALRYNVRVPTTTDNNALFTEPSIQSVEIDFLPPLRVAQAGRASYMAGGQLWSYDGIEVTEAGFHLCPEFTLTAAPGGTLTALGTYSYRIDLCYRNAQNEEIRSHSILTQVTLGGGQQKINLLIKTMLSRRSNSYFLIFRNAMVSGVPTASWNLLNSRDPTSASYLSNDQTVVSVSYSDDGTVTDTAIQSREFHPANAGNTYLLPFSAPACEIVAAGRDRLWVAGGELGPGQIAPSRLFDPGEVPAFNANIWQQVDRSDLPITAIGFVGDIGVMFRRDSAYVLDGNGPDNVAQGYWSPARLALADTGAVSQDSISLVSQGLLFQAPAGIRLLGPGGALQPVGLPVDTLAKTLTIRATVSVEDDHEIRFYHTTGALVYNYVQSTWSTWTCGAYGAVKSPLSGRAILFNQGKFWIEEGASFSDDGQPYEHRIRTGWLSSGSLGDFQRVRKISGFGTWDPDEGHTVRVEVYYNERDFPGETWRWDVPDVSQNTDTWGSGSWGDGVWGDTAAPGSLRDSVWRFRRRPRRQKCNIISISISDQGSEGPGFRLSVIGLELARKPGLDRIRPVGGTDVF